MHAAASAVAAKTPPNLPGICRPPLVTLHGQEERASAPDGGTSSKSICHV
jgi:hypothetical protein